MEDDLASEPLQHLRGLVVRGATVDHDRLPELGGKVELRDVGEEGDEHEVLTGDYEGWEGRWAPSELAPGGELPKPRPLFKKLDPEAVVAEELARMRQRAGDDEPASAA